MRKDRRIPSAKVPSYHRICVNNRCRRARGNSRSLRVWRVAQGQLLEGLNCPRTFKCHLDNLPRSLNISISGRTMQIRTEFASSTWWCSRLTKSSRKGSNLSKERIRARIKNFSNTRVKAQSTTILTQTASKVKGNSVAVSKIRRNERQSLWWRPLSCRQAQTSKDQRSKGKVQWRSANPVPDSHYCRPKTLSDRSQVTQLTFQMKTKLI